MSSTESSKTDTKVDAISGGGDAPSSSNTQPTATASTPPDFGVFKVWNPPESSARSPAGGPLSESYFEPTAAELKQAFQDQSRLVERLSNAPLKTQAIRDREAKAKLDRWPETTIRIRFPNLMMLEHKFPSSSAIKVVYAYVRNALIDEAKPNKFVLYEATPRRELRVSDSEVKTKSLAQLNLAPSSILHFSFLEESLNSTSTPPPLLPMLLSTATDLPPPPSFEPPASAQPKSRAGQTLSGNVVPEPDKKLPKWLKLGKK